jgi:hypothetical protein
MYCWRLVKKDTSTTQKMTIESCLWQLRTMIWTAEYDFWKLCSLFTILALRQLVWNQKMCNFMDGKFYDLSIT